MYRKIKTVYQLSLGLSLQIKTPLDILNIYIKYSSEGLTSKLNLSQIPTEPSKRISYTVGDHLRHFAKQDLLSP